LHTPKIALNVELGDSAIVDQRQCGCPLEALGWTTHLAQIRSFEKLSSEGTTFARANLTGILEEVLPARFGGSAIDYQLLEEEAEDGSTVLALLVHPHVGPLDEADVRAALLDAMAAGGFVDAYQVRLLRQAESVTVRREPPLVTRAGKVLTYHLARPGKATAPVGSGRRPTAV